MAYPNNMEDRDLQAPFEALESWTLAAWIKELDRVETWRDVVAFPGYQVSSWGRVSGKRVGYLRSAKTNGYHHVSMSHAGTVTTVRVAVLVARTFLGEPPFEGADAAHNDGNTDNNRVSNVRWASKLENQADIDRHGHRVKGSDVFGARLTEADVPIIRRRAMGGERYENIAEDFGVSISTISLIKLGKIWQHVSANDK
ncbi:NUMOD4 motif-containing HNH endonuclease [Mesorhizobium sp. M0184]|uniref:HNH endonuclease n=1 Tax=Mesorhizobium sp. M0184 TaxID=2956906 RepID=UPI0033386E7F